MQLLSRFTPVDGAFYPALVALGIAAAIFIGWLVWDHWLRDGDKDR
jgi:hypothetical protein